MATARQIVELFQEAARARAEERSAFKESGGTSWGYFGYSYIKAAEEAEKAAEEALTEFVDGRIKAALDGNAEA